MTRRRSTRSAAATSGNGSRRRNALPGEPNAVSLNRGMSTEIGVPTTNDEAIQAWDGPLFESFTRFRDVITTGLGNHGEAALALYPPQPGQRVLDIGCGFGDTTQRIAGMVGPEGQAVGMDAAPSFIEAAHSEATQSGVSNVRFEAIDVQTGELDGPYDMAFSRMGVMFFANPVQALRNVRGALKQG